MRIRGGGMHNSFVRDTREKGKENRRGMLLLLDTINEFCTKKHLFCFEAVNIKICSVALG